MPNAESFPLPADVLSDGESPLTPRPQALQSFNTMGLPAHAATFVTVDRVTQIPALIRLMSRYSSTLILGGGSNLLLPDALGGLVAAVRFAGIRVLGERDDALLVEAAAGERWHALVQWCVTQGLGGLENLALIPGTVGAAPVQNIGAYGLEIAERLVEVRAWDLQRAQAVVLSAEACAFAYRDSRFKQDGQGRWLITSVVLALPRRWTPRMNYPDLQRHPALMDKPVEALQPRDVFDAVCAVRQAKLPDPAVLGNAGSFFKNPVVSASQAQALAQQYAEMPQYPQADGGVKLAAGWLIDRCGWKGQSLGPVGMHARQALVMVNHGGAHLDDVLRLQAAVAASVQARFGVALEREPIVAQAA